MGCYINPQNETKEQFLAREGLPPDSFEQFRDWHERPEGMYPVILINNYGLFSAAGVAYSPRELEIFLDPRAGVGDRDFQCFYVEADKLREVAPLDHYLELASR